MSNKDKILQLSVVGLVGLGLGIVARLFLIDYGKDTGTANWTMFAIVGGFILLYSLFMEIYTPLASRFTRKKSENEIEEKPAPDRKGEPSQYINQLNESNKPSSVVERKPTVTDLKLESFEKYCDKVMKDYMSADDLERLKKYVGYYAHESNEPIITKASTQQIGTYDILHFGWNMWKHFNITIQLPVAEWLKNVFTELKDIDLSTIERNLKHKEKGGNYLIDIRKRID